jgi:hypothetical protein
MSTTIARVYHADRNPSGASLPGVPLSDLTEADFSELPEWLQISVDATGFYDKPEAPKAKAARKDDQQTQ